MSIFLRFLLRFPSKLYILGAIERWPFFGPKSHGMPSLKRHFLKNFSTDFAEISCAHAKFLGAQGDASFASISALIFNLLQSLLGGALYATHQAMAG